MAADASVMKFPIMCPQFKPKLLSFSATGTSGVQEVSQIVCVADSAGSLNNRYFNITTPTNAYYVWFNVNGAGVDPAVSGRTAVPVTLATNAANTAVATAVAAALDALSDIVATPASATVTATNVADGSVANAANGTASPGFTITTPTQGVDSLVALGFGKFDATIAEASGPGDYTITFNEPFVQIPQVVVMGSGSVAPRIAAVSVSAVQVQMNNMSGNLIDSNFHMLVFGSQAVDLID